MKKITIWKNLLIILMISIPSFSFYSSNVNAQPMEVWVDDDFGPGTPGWQHNHFNIIQEGIDAVGEDGMVYVFNGTYYENVFINKSIHLIGEDINNTLIDGSGNEDVMYVSSDSVSIHHFSIQNSGTEFPFDAGIEINSNNNFINGNIFKNNRNGIRLKNSCNNNISNNQFDNDYFGIILGGYSKNNTIQANTIINTSMGIRVEGYSNAKIINNTIHANAGFHIWSGGNFLRDNEFISCGITIDTGKIGMYNDIDTSNTIDGRPIYYLSNKSGLTVPANASAVFLLQCENSTISNLNINNNGDGIVVGWCKNITIANNTIYNYSDGIELISSTNNTVINNVIKSNGNSGIGILLRLNSNNNLINTNYMESIRTAYMWGTRGIDVVSSNDNIIVNNIIKNHSGHGIWLYSNSDNNLIYHNNLINNRINEDECSNSWDNGYLSGGNYWDDYVGDDIYKGIYQDIPGADGIGDTPYTITGDSNQDRYPLMHPYNASSNVSFQGLEPMYTTESIEIGININPHEPIAGVQFDMSFDSSMLSVEWVAEGDVFSEYDTYFDPGIIDNTNGSLKNVVSLITTPGGNTTNQGSIAIVSIRAKTTPGETPLNLSNVIVGGPDGTPIDVTIINTTVMIYPHDRWDVNWDGRINILDLIIIGQWWGEMGTPCWVSADVNCDGVINILDMVLVGQHWTG